MYRELYRRQQMDWSAKEPNRNFSIKKDYSILELKFDATFEEVRKNYLRLSLKYHPDKGGSVEEFRKVNESYNNILDKMTKRLQREEDIEKDMTLNEVDSYKLSKSDIAKYNDHLIFKEYFGKLNYHDEFYENVIIRPFKLFFNMNYKEVSGLNASETYVYIVEKWNKLSTIQKRKYRGMVNTIDLYAKFKTLEQLIGKIEN